MSPLFSFLDQCSLSPSGFHLTWEPTTRRGRKQTDFALIQSPCRTFQRRNQSGSCPTQDPCHRYLTANPDNRKYRSSTCQSLYSQSTLHLVTKAQGRQVNCICVAPCVHSAPVLFLHRYAVTARGDHSQPRTHGGPAMGAVRRHAPELPRPEPRPSCKGDCRKHLLE